MQFNILHNCLLERRLLCHAFWAMNSIQNFSFAKTASLNLLYVTHLCSIVMLDRNADIVMLLLVLSRKITT